MRKRFWIPLCLLLLVFLVRAGMERRGDEDRASEASGLPPVSARAPEPERSPAAFRGEMPAPPAEAPLPTAPPDVRETQPSPREAAPAVGVPLPLEPLPDQDVPETAVVPSEEKPSEDKAQEETTPKPRRHDGDLGRATLKSQHLRDRSREALGGSTLADINVPATAGRRLGEESLATPLLEERVRKRLGGTDLADLGDAPGSLGRRVLGGGDLRDLSRGEDDRGDLADRSGRPF